MVDAVSENNRLDIITNDDFKKIYRHLCIASKILSKQERKERTSPLLEKKIISEKIEALERKEHSKSDDWIKNKLDQKQVISKESEIKDIKNHIIDIRKSIEALSHNKSVNKEKLKALKDKLEKLEFIISKEEKRNN